MRIFISTGEVSGDLQGAMLIKALKHQAQLLNLDLEIVALGGERMAEAGATLLGNTAIIGSVGIIEALPFIIPTWQRQKYAKEYLRSSPPDVLILIDYPSPNMAIGNYVRRNFPKLPIIYYIAPQDWVIPRLGHAAKMSRFVDLLLAIFPAEARYFQEQGLRVNWVGHPLLDRLEDAPNRQQARQTLGIAPEKLIVALIPASREQELKYLLPVICSAAKQLQAKLPEVHFLIPLSLAKYKPAIEEAIDKYNLPATICEGKSLNAIAGADLAITKSGTVNLEIALLNVPQVVLYRINSLTAWVARNLLKFSLPFMSPVNLVLMKEIVPELPQEKATAENIAAISLELLSDKTKREQMIREYQNIRSSLGAAKVSERTAEMILQFVINAKIEKT